MTSVVSFPLTKLNCSAISDGDYICTWEWTTLNVCFQMTDKPTMRCGDIELTEEEEENKTNECAHDSRGEGTSSGPSYLPPPPPYSPMAEEFPHSPPYPAAELGALTPRLPTPKKLPPNADDDVPILDLTEEDREEAQEIRRRRQIKRMSRNSRYGYVENLAQVLEANLKMVRIERGPVKC
ncbi:hypothetical protein CAPTEDRAFT_217590 [Capitella teleta]|uniref:Uncharacterized protein n=1 Tax=Capitella teleta TaxID=283909 RepID=R7TZZ9_CAPTE|nr:hypothetical protein CAPTEDRAFT_217590 [Capitella teleta]|eukprot:ELT96986.1 hypothetical protein CAPTEDRAFT_217590 [Capitella teleta]